MPEDSLPRRARRVLARVEEVAKLGKDRADLLKPFRDRIDAGEDRETVLQEIEVLLGDQVDQEIEQTQEEITEIRALTEEIELVFAEASIEASKLRADALKQQATFSAGAIVGIAAITRGILPTAQTYVPLLYVAYGLLLVTVSISLVLMHVEASRVEWALRRGRTEPRGGLERILYYAAAGGFATSVLVFALFMAFNLGIL